MKKYFRFHRGIFADSMNTMVEVNGLSDIINLVNHPDGLFKNIHIDKEGIRDERCLGYGQWGVMTYHVLADFDGYENQCIGMCNFYEV